MSSNEGRVYFALDGGNIEPEELSKFLGIEATSIYRKDSREFGKRSNINSWELSTPNVIGEYVDVYELSKELIVELLPKKDLIIAAIKRFNFTPRFEVVLCISTNEEHSTPAIAFDANVVKFLGEVGAYIDIDTYRN
ncbi:DUF4279 domain-containing protein (plasmid) [Catenovulum sp. SX2]|uniref:DUF4279 domain-containing protein n=1 Tax=Catenovulum sp. SX2 TaxID=3398614 RepID=UPI003F867C75